MSTILILAVCLADAFVITGISVYFIFGRDSSSKWWNFVLVLGLFITFIAGGLMTAKTITSRLNGLEAVAAAVYWFFSGGVMSLIILAIIMIPAALQLYKGKDYGVKPAPHELEPDVCSERWDHGRHSETQENNRTTASQAPLH